MYDGPGGWRLQIYPSSEAGRAPQTLIGWETQNIEADVAELKAAGVDVRINIVVFAIENAKLKQAFRYWADVGGGSYFDATGSEELKASLTRALRVPFEVFSSNGEVVAQGLTGGDAVQLPVGSYRITVRSRPPQTVAGVQVKSGETETVSLGNR